MKKSDIDFLKKAGVEDGEILEANQIICYFNYVNRSINGLGVSTEGDTVGYYSEEWRGNLSRKSNFFAKDGTAQGVVKQRLIETIAKPEEHIINDPYAERFVLGARFIKLMGHKLNVWLGKKFISGFH